MCNIPTLKFLLVGDSTVWQMSLVSQILIIAAAISVGVQLVSDWETDSRVDAYIIIQACLCTYPRKHFACPCTALFGASIQLSAEPWATDMSDNSMHVWVCLCTALSPPPPPLRCREQWERLAGMRCEVTVDSCCGGEAPTRTTHYVSLHYSFLLVKGLLCGGSCILLEVPTVLSALLCR